MNFDIDPNVPFMSKEEIHEIVGDEAARKAFCEKLLDRIVYETTLGMIFDAHRKHTTKTFSLDRDDDPPPGPSAAGPFNPNLDIFGNQNIKKTQECDCPNCGRPVAAIRFAPHLEKCMGLGRNRSRNVRRATSNKDRESASYSGMGSDDEDDVDWGSGEKKTRKKKDRNGSKKGGKGTPKKASETESSDTVDIEGEEENELTSSLRDMLQDHSNGSSPTDSSTGSVKKREKNKSKKNKKDRASPNVNQGAE